MTNRSDYLLQTCTFKGNFFLMDLSLEKELHIREITQEARNGVNNPRVKPVPTLGEQTIPTPFSYLPSGDGTDENLLILLHGLGEFRNNRVAQDTSRNA